MKLKQHKRLRIAGIRLLVFLVLFLIIEIALRIFGFKPYVLINWAHMPATIIEDSVLYGDEHGISHYYVNGYYKKDGKINKQGFIGSFDYDSSTIAKIRRTTSKKIVMAVGDSFLDGCCSDSVSNSFAGILSNNSDYAFLNFGIAGADPLQYKLIVENYAPEIIPDMIVIVFYLGNDILTYDRTPKPFIPSNYVPKGGSWLSSEPPYHLAKPNYVLKDFNTAIEFYQSWYSLRGRNRNRILRLMGNSIMFSKLYLGVEFNYKRWQIKDSAYTPPSPPPYSYTHLKFIDNYCSMNGIKLLVVGIPSPVDIQKEVDWKNEYSYCFNDIPVNYPNDLKLSDYDGKSIGNHFNNRGHLKFSIFLDALIKNGLNK